MHARALFAVLTLCACAPEARQRVELETPAIDGVESGPPSFEPEDALVHLGRRGPRRYEVVLRASDAVVRAEGACPRTIARDDRFVRLEPLFEIAGERAQVGFGERFELRVVPKCAEGRSARWSADGEIDELEIDGLRIRGRMPELAPMPRDPGVVAISPRTRGTIRLRLLVAGTELTIDVHAAARATGVPSVAVGARTYLSGAAELAQAPPGSHALLADGAFTPDVRGRYAFRASDGSAFTIYAGTHSATDLDCGRSECHREAAEHARASPMTSVFARLVEEASYEPACAIGCHTAGEPGLDDGGFADVLTELGAALPSHGGPGTYASLPRELRRLSGVGCTSCHGPGAIPEPGARARISRTDVCAVCHDAPPRYGHVLAWRSTRMGTPDSNAELARPECARCHTSVEGGSEITCVACHAVHAESGPSLTRSENVCARCHDVDRTLDLPTASAVALVTGTGAYGVDGIRAPHAALERGCLACHGTGSLDGIERGASHTFTVDPDVCDTCHEEEVRAPGDLGQRIAALTEHVPHTARSLARPGAPADDLARARWNVGLLAHDRGAWAHGGPSVISIVEATERLLGTD
jgi:hypothetical protein